MVFKRSVAVMVAVVVACFTLLLMADAYAQWHRDRGHDRRGRGHHRHWEHRQPAPAPQQGIDYGAIIGGVIGAFSRPSRDDVAYCMQRYRSYNPETGVYYGYDGQPRRCP